MIVEQLETKLLAKMPPQVSAMSAVSATGNAVLDIALELLAKNLWNEATKAALKQAALNLWDRLDLPVVEGATEDRLKSLLRPVIEAVIDAAFAAVG